MEVLFLTNSWALSFPKILQWLGIHWKAINLLKSYSLRIYFWQFKRAVKEELYWDFVIHRATLESGRMTASINLSRNQKSCFKRYIFLWLHHSNLFYQYTLKIKKKWLQKTPALDSPWHKIKIYQNSHPVSFREKGIHCFHRSKYKIGVSKSHLKYKLGIRYSYSSVKFSSFSRMKEKIQT